MPSTPIKWNDAGGRVTADEILSAAAQHMRDRTATYDQPEGERSMAATVAAYTLLTGQPMTEEDGWLFMALLKIVRHRQRPEPHRDSLEDLVAYASLMAESALEGDS